MTPCPADVDDRDTVFVEEGWEGRPRVAACGVDGGVIWSCGPDGPGLGEAGGLGGAAAYEVVDGGGGGLGEGEACFGGGLGVKPFLEGGYHLGAGVRGCL